MVIRDVRLIHKSGGRTGTFERREPSRRAVPFADLSEHRSRALRSAPVQVHWYGLCICSPFLPGGAGWRAGARRVRRGSRRAERAEGRRPAHGSRSAWWRAGASVGPVLLRSAVLPCAALGDFQNLERRDVLPRRAVSVLWRAGWWSRCEKKRFRDVVDFVAPLVPPGSSSGVSGTSSTVNRGAASRTGPRDGVPTGGPCRAIRRSCTRPGLKAWRCS